VRTPRARHRVGVDDYLGKPYQEAQLLDAIAPLWSGGAPRRSAGLRLMTERVTRSTACWYRWSMSG